MDGEKEIDDDRIGASEKDAAPRDGVCRGLKSSNIERNLSSKSKIFNNQRLKTGKSRSNVFIQTILNIKGSD